MMAQPIEYIIQKAKIMEGNWKETRKCWEIRLTNSRNKLMTLMKRLIV